jgi:hypothetical protein
MLRHAFKEWAVVCQALARGQQGLILRKGGIDENSGEFQLEHTRFWLYPTFVHQQRDGIVPAAAPLLEEAERSRPPQGTIRLAHFAEVAGVYQLHDEAGLLKLQGLHLWSWDTVHARFKYRRPGLWALAVRVHRAVQHHDLPELPAYAGCRSWVDLEPELPTEGTTPVLSDEQFRDLLRTLDERLHPVAFA